MLPGANRFRNMAAVTEPSPEPLSYYAPWQAVFVRPVAVSVVAWIGVVLGALALICGGVGVLGRQVMLRQVASFSGMGPRWDTLQAVEMWVNVVLSAVLMFASLGCLYLRPAARRVIIGYAVFAIGWAAGSVVLRHVVWRATYANPDAAAVTALVLCVGLLFSCAMPVAVLIVMTRPYVRFAFQTGGMTWYAGGYPQPSPPAAT